MKRALAVVGAFSLACGGLLIDHTGVEHTFEALSQASVEPSFNLFVSGMGLARVPNPLCGELVANVSQFSPEMKRTVQAKVLFDEPRCPTSCAGDVASTLGTMPDAEAVSLASSVCDATAPDPLVGPLEPLRDHADVVDYLMFRMLWDALPEADRDAGAMEKVAISMALAGPRKSQQSVQLVVSGKGVDKAAVAAQQAAFFACSEPVDHRVVLGPAGVFVAGNPCGAEVLRSMGLPATEEWSVVDVSWTPPQPVPPSEP